MILYLAAVLLAAFSGVPGLFSRRKGGQVAAGMLGAAAILGLAAALWALLGSGTWSLRLPASPMGQAGLLRFDPIAAFFLIPVLVLPACGSIYAVAYWGDGHESARRVRLCFGLLTAFLALLVASAHAFTFLLAWECMAILAFLLVIAEDRKAETQRAGWIYLLATHSGTLCLFGAFALMGSANGDYGFSALAPGFASSGRGTLTFALFMLGFSVKAGVFPLHFWLPGAHAAAPSHVSSFMSGVLIKMGILGMARLLTWIPDPPLWWGGLLVFLGALSGILGVALALGQHDLKRLLAYHSIENIGIILLGLGVGTLGRSLGNAAVEVLGYAGGLFHVLNHGLFKGLLFLGAGSVVHATGTRDLEKLGGLSRVMPFTSKCFLAGAWAICGLPPFNGFVSEWLIYLGAFHGLLAFRQPWFIVAVTALSIIGALALACFAKAYGAVFLGLPRHLDPEAVQEAPRPMRIPMAMLAGLCALLGLAPVLVAPVLDRLAAVMGSGASLPGVLHLARLPVLSLLSLVLAGLALICWRWAAASPGRRDIPTWDCGYARPSARMQYTASSFADGLVSGMAWILWPKVHIRRIVARFPRPSRFRSQVPDPALDRLGAPGLELAVRGAGWLRPLQSGHLPLYLSYVLVTLLALLIWMVV